MVKSFTCLFSIFAWEKKFKKKKKRKEEINQKLKKKILELGK